MLVLSLIAIGVLIGLLLLVSLLLSAKLQRFISDPILRLTQLARTVTARQDYSLRADKAG